MNNRQKILLSATAFTFFLLILGPTARAGSLGIDCGTGGCTLGTSDPLFSESEIYPGWSVTKSIRAKNSYPEDRRFAVSVEGATFTDSTPSLSEALIVTITERDSGAVAYGPATMADWKDIGFTALSTVPAGEERIYDLTVALGNVGDEYQGKSLGFDLNLGFESLPPGPATASFPGGVVSGTATVRGGLTALGGAAEESEGEIAGAEVSYAPEEGVVSGEGTVVCQDPLWWPLAILIQLLVAFLIHRQTQEKGRWQRYALTIQIAAAIAAVILLAKLFCPWWLPLVGAIIGIIAVYLGLRNVTA